MAVEEIEALADRAARAESRAAAASSLSSPTSTLESSPRVSLGASPGRRKSPAQRAPKTPSRGGREPRVNYAVM